VIKEGEGFMETDQDIPAGLQPQVEGALSWINATQGESFSLTSVVGYEDALSAKTGESYELGLVLCNGEICTREQIRVEPAGTDKFLFSFADIKERDIPPLLDPPEGLRSDWTDSVLDKHEFVVMVFYRGLW
jgi:hypothetical protein